MELIVACLSAVIALTGWTIAIALRDIARAIREKP